MKSPSLLWARTVSLLGGALVFAGIALLLYLFALLFFRYGAPDNVILRLVLEAVDQSLLALATGITPGVPDAWLTSMNLAVAGAVLGAMLGWLGMFVASRQAARIEAERRRAADRLRRVHAYRDSARVEPFIGPGAEVGVEEGEISPRTRGRRVA